MLNQMDLALTDEINAQGKKSGNHIAVDGELIAEQSGQHLYIFTLQDPWEPQDDAPVKINIGGAHAIKGLVVTSTGTTITIATENPLPPEALHKITLAADPTELLERLREALKNNKEGPSQLGSKSFGLLSFSIGKRSSSITFGEKVKPDKSQERAIQLALGSEVTPACTYTEDIGEQHLNSIAWLVNTSCRNCGGQMAVKTNRKDAWLVCGAPMPCGFGHRITYSRSG